MIEYWDKRWKFRSLYRRSLDRQRRRETETNRERKGEREAEKEKKTE